MFKFSRIGALALGLLLLGGCGSDYNLPDVESVDAMQGDTLIEAYVPSETSEDAFSEMMPVDVHFVIHFDETMDLTSLEEYVYFNDARQNKLDATISSRLSTVTVRLASGTFDADMDNFLFIGDDVEDINGWEMLNGYNIAFHTEP